jgi:hypothetical protein
MVEVSEGLRVTLKIKFFGFVSYLSYPFHSY